jgi:dephospho-CoA kinase
MPRRPFLVGLTGSIGMGKSETAKMFAALGVPVFDADAAVHALYAPGGAAVVPIGKAFPGAVTADGVDRGKLGVLLHGAADFARLESIVHPLIEKAEKDFIAAAAAKGAPLVVLNIPLLFEAGRGARVDATVVASAPAEVQRARVLARPGMTADLLDRILARQMPDAEKRKRADFVVDTSRGLGYAEAEVKKIVDNLTARTRGKGE